MAAMRAAPSLLRVAGTFQPKIRRAVEGRALSLTTLLDWGATQRDRARPLLWLHAPSVGEALMAQAILEKARNQLPELQSIFTYFSPSAERVAARVGADWAGYLPWESPPLLRRVLDVVQPQCIAFVRTEIWPALTREAARRNVPVLLVNAALAESSSRTGKGARMLLGPAYRRLHAVGAISTDDAARFALFDVPRNRVHITGDARFDQVAQRVAAIDRSQPLLQSLKAARGPWLVAGSTWPSDDERLVEALAQLTPLGTAFRAIIAPHEPTVEHLQALRQRLDAKRIRNIVLPQNDDTTRDTAPVIIVDRVGVLADLYAIAAVAYVGGGFGDAGLHSVIEPAALGVPVVFGPRHGNAREATRLVAAGGGHIVHTVVEVRDTLSRWLRDDAARKRAGLAARAFVDAHRGGAAKNAQLIVRALSMAGHREERAVREGTT
jgi:3-deoxy-D-manno-octulosonic-acid transferase